MVRHFPVLHFQVVHFQSPLFVALVHKFDKQTDEQLHGVAL